MGESETEQLEVRNKEQKRSGPKKKKGRRNKRQTNGTVRNQVSKRESVLPEEFKEGSVDAAGRGILHDREKREKGDFQPDRSPDADRERVITRGNFISIHPR